MAQKKLRPTPSLNSANSIFYQCARPVLKYPVLTFDAEELAVVAQGIADAVAEQQYTCYACAVMPDHLHILIRKHKHQAEQMIEVLQATSRQRIMEMRRRDPDHPVWTLGGWKVFLDHPDEVRRTIRYIENNPFWAGMPAQEWMFVKPYDGWPLHPGHSPNSPYAKRLREAGRY